MTFKKSKPIILISVMITVSILEEECKMSLIGTQIMDYKLQGYQNGEFKEFTAEAAKGKWAVMYSIQQTSLSFAQLN